MMQKDGKRCSNNFGSSSLVYHQQIKNDVKSLFLKDELAFWEVLYPLALFLFERVSAKCEFDCKIVTRIVDDFMTLL